jgi:hypothetical protein
MIFERSSRKRHRDGAEILREKRSGFRQQAPNRRLDGGSFTPAKRLNLSVILPRGFHPFPSRTRKLSPAGPIVLHAKVCGRVGRCRHK